MATSRQHEGGHAEGQRATKPTSRMQSIDGAFAVKYDQGTHQ